MTGKRSNFPLPLSSLNKPGNAGVAPPRTAQFTPARVATPSTASQNAARTAAQSPRPALSPVPPPAAPQGYAARRPEPLPLSAPRQDLMVSDAIRRAMVQRVAKQGVSDELVLNALATVPRHAFIEPALSAQAYIDASLPIGHQQTISQPYIVARMIEVMRNGSQLRNVLEIGTGCGYQAAVLACVARNVYSIERIKPLHELAKNNLRPLRIANLRLHYGDGMLGLPQAAPFDGIILAAAGLEVPQALLEQLAIGGRLVAPVGASSQRLELVTRTAKAEWVRETLEDCHFVPLRPGTI